MKLVLTGHYAGQTVLINGSQFINGELVLKGELSKMDGLIRYLSTYNAFLSGSRELADAQERDRINAGGSNGVSEVLDGPAGPDTGGAPADITTPGTGSGDGATGASTDGAGSGSDGDGVQAGQPVDEGKPQVSPDSTVLKIIDGIKSLDPSNDDHWTDAGLPRVDMVATASGVVNVTRKDIAAALPNWNREVAMNEV